MGSATAADCDLLGLDEGAPVVLIERLAFGFDNRPIEWRLTRGRRRASGTTSTSAEGLDGGFAARSYIHIND